MVDALLSQNDRMEALSRVYVGAIAAKAGYSLGSLDFDRDSIDLTIHAGGAMRPQIGLQLKATTGIPTAASTFSYNLKVKNYNDLRVKTLVPRILVVLALPKKNVHWIDHKVQRLVVRRCAYWKSLLNYPATTNETTVAVTMDTQQVFDVTALLDLMKKAGAGMPL